MKSLKASVVLCGLVLMVGAGIVLSSQIVSAHCQIPCGIYGDETRFSLLNEHITTVEKAIKVITELSEDPEANANQLTRWVASKDKHADEIAEIITQYFLQQRIKIDEKDEAAYVKKLTLCHHILVAAMKAKQTTDQQYVEKLRGSVAAFQEVYSAK